MFSLYQDTNDHVPEFERYEYRFQLSEDSSVGTKIGQLKAYDLDRDSNGTVKFDLIKSFDDTFKLDSRTGELFLMKKLDKECDKERYVLKAQVSDLDNKVNDKLATIKIDLSAVNHNKLVWLDQHQSISSYMKQQCNGSVSSNKIEQFRISSHSRISTVVTKIRALDMDRWNSTIHYTIKHIQVQSNGQFIDYETGKELFNINSGGLITTKQLFVGDQNQVYRLAIEAVDSKGLKTDQLKWIEIIVKPTTANKAQDKALKSNSDVEYIEIESLSAGQAVGPVIDLKHFKHADNQQVLSGCDTFYLNSASDDIDLPFTLNISDTKINLVSLTDSFEATRLTVYFKDCSLSLSTGNQSTKNSQKLLTFEIELKEKQTKDLPFDCLRRQLKSTEFGEELMQINLDLNQETSYEKSIDLFDFKRCSTIQPNQQFKLSTIRNESIKLLNQLKLNSDLVLQLWIDDDQLPYDQELLLNIQALNGEFGDANLDDILMNFVFNRRTDFNLNNLKVINEKDGELMFDENCCSKGEIIHQILLNSDLGETNEVRFKFANNRTEYELFRIDNNGLLSLTSEFDYETQSVYDLNILIEVNELQLSSSKLVKQLDHSVKIVINDVNDEIPKLNQQELEIEFAESTPIGSLLTRIKATDRDQMDTNLTYLIPDGYQYKKTFELNSKTGELRLKSTLDRERIANYRIPIVVFDSDYQHDQAFLNLKVIDINDNKPLFKQLESTVVIPENLPINTPVYTFIASDEDESNQLSYDLINCNSCPFKLDSRTGQLTTKDKIDFETTSSYNLTVSVTDGQYSSNCNLLIRIKNLNDNAPTLELNEITIDLDQVRPNEQFYDIVTLKASDLDRNAKLYYSINLETSDANHFTMNSTSGQLTINQAVLDELLKKKLTNRLNEKSITVEFDVQVIDITEYNVLSATGRIRIRFDGSKYLAELRDELVELSRERIKFSQYPIVLELNEQFLNKKLSEYLVSSQANDVVFELVNQTSDFEKQFSLSSAGEFSLRQSLKNRNYECFVLAKSRQYGETLNLIQFTRMPIIHTPTQLRKFSFELNLEENLDAGQRLIQLEERVNIYLKSDHHFKLIYSSVNPDWFHLDARTGLLRTAVRFDYEKHPSKIELIVLASLPDSYNNLMLFNLSINLINVNDNGLIFNHPIIYTAINESLPKDTFVCKLASIDLDSLDGQSTTYHIVEGNRDQAFKIVDNSIYTNVVLDREIRESYTLFIFANDALHHSPLHHSSLHAKQAKSNSLKYQTVEIAVLDINDNLPYLASNQELSITTDNTASQLVGTLNSNDVDAYPLMLTYELAKDSNYEFNRQLFDLNQFTGEIRLRNKIKPNDSLVGNGFIDYENPLREFNFNVIASDSLHQGRFLLKTF